MLMTYTTIPVLTLGQAFNRNISWLLISSSNDAEQLQAVETTLEVEAAGKGSRL